MSETETNNNNKSLVTGVIILAVLVVGYVLWVSYANKKIREVVDSSIAQFEENLAQRGHQVSITYDDVKVHGMTLRPRASVYKVHVKMEDPRRRREVHLMMPEVVYVPKNFRMTSYALEAVEGMGVTTVNNGVNDEDLLVEFSKVPALNVQSNRDKSVDYQLNLPTTITLTDVVDGGAQEESDKLDVTFASEPNISWSTDATGATLDQHAELPRTVITENQKEMASLDSFAAITKHNAEADGRVSYNTQVKLENLVFAGAELEVLNPVNVMNDISYTGAAAGSPDAATQKLDVDVKSIVWTSGLLGLSASGEVHLDPTQEKMPYGKLDVQLQKVDSFFAYAQQQRPDTVEFIGKLRAALEQFSGAAVEEGGDVTIMLQREPKGHLQVGNLSLEEALATVFSLAMQLPDLSASDETAVEPEEGDAAEEMVAPEVAAEAEEKLAPVEEVAPVAEPQAEVTTQPTKPETEVEIKEGAGEVSIEMQETVEDSSSEAAATPETPALEGVKESPDNADQAVVPVE